MRMRTMTNQTGADQRQLKPRHEVSRLDITLADSAPATRINGADFADEIQEGVLHINM